jgi:type II secretory pathway component GspD/PulD (secretin)
VEEGLAFIESPGDGIVYRTSTLTPTRETTDSVDLSQTASSDVSDIFAQTISQNKAAILDVDGFDVVISALKRAEGVTVVSNPKIIVSSGQTNAFFSVGVREPIIKKTIKRGTIDSPGDEIIANLDTQISTDFIRNGYLNTGIELRVIPVVKTDELIEAKIIPSLRRKVGEKTVEGNSWPVISVKEIATQFTLRSGQTVAIGGLTDTVTDREVSSIPVLGAIPIIGKYLFSHEKDVKKQSETIIFVTLSLADASIIKDDAAIPLHSQLIYDKKRDMDAQARIRREKRELRQNENTATVERDATSSQARGLIPELMN